MHQGMVQIYTGNGKGKTTAALGQAIRAAGRGFRVKIYQFLKPPFSSGEHFFSERIKDFIDIIPVGAPHWLRQGQGLDSGDVNLALNGLILAREEMLSGRIDMLILDELDLAVYFDLIKVEEVLDLIDSRPPQVEIIITGRMARQELLDRADLITEMTLHRHPFNQGILAREGIEY